MHNIKLLPKQWEVFNPAAGVDYDICLYQGGVGAGKTMLGTIKGLKVLAQNPGSRWLVGADTYERLKISTCETYLELLDAGKIRHKHNKSDKVITIPGWGNAKVLFKGVDDPKSLRSVNGIGGHLEESSMLTVASYEEFLGRLRQADLGTPIEVILTTNPQATKGWQYEQFVENGGLSIINIRGRDIKINRRRVIAATLDNPHVSDAFIASLKATYDEELWKIMVLGQDGDYTRGLVNYNFSDLNIQDTKYRPDLTIYLSCDFNVDPMSWVLAHKFNDEYHFFDEIVVENTNINECVDEFVRRYPDHTNQVIITGDASGNNRDVRTEQIGGTSYTQMLNRFSFNNYKAKVRVDVREKNPAVLDRTAAWNAMVCNTNGVRRVFISRKCKWLIRNMENLRYKEGTGEIEEPSANEIKKDSKQKFIKHIWDAASYLVEKYDPITLRTKNKRPDVIVPKALKFRA